MLSIVAIKKDSSLGQFFVGPSRFAFNGVFIFYFEFIFSRQILITLLIFLWCARLTIYFFMRYKKGADPRYVAWLAQWNHPLVASFMSFGWVVFLNGGFSLIMALPAIVVNIKFIAIIAYFLDFSATILWIVGFYWETVSDYQLFVFSHNPTNKGKVCDQGLWRYSRHPNYFGEIVMWWAVYLIALSVPYGWITIICPLAITTTLVFVTGIPWNEKAMANSAAYQEYKKHTSMLIPWFSKE